MQLQASLSIPQKITKFQHFTIDFSTIILYTKEGCAEAAHFIKENHFPYEQKKYLCAADAHA